ncbi:hypothetical protein BGX31_011024 [Mortierella sp. GBA43]|nr:hypothetical protein BGX31_011024 [Mortierella sp. GBA43]
MAKLPDRPDEGVKVSKVPGSTAKKMFPSVADRLSEAKDYTFTIYLKKCTGQPAYKQVQFQSGPYSEPARTETAYNLGLELGLDKNLLDIFNYLPKVDVKSGIARGSENVKLPGVDIDDGETMEECLVAPGWSCTGVISLSDNGEFFVKDSFEEPKFFPAANYSTPLIRDGWYDVFVPLRRVGFCRQ